MEPTSERETVRGRELVAESRRLRDRSCKLAMEAKQLDAEYERLIVRVEAREEGMGVDILFGKSVRSTRNSSAVRPVPN
jgi:hypothetical protein